MSKIIPLISSGIAGPIGVLHLPRLWQKVSLDKMKESALESDSFEHQTEVFEIVIPKEIGEGLFGISFKMKGPKGKIKTSINPIRTLTPRFLQKIIDRKKMSR